MIFGKNLFFTLGRRSAEGFGIRETICEIGVRRKRVKESGVGGGVIGILGVGGGVIGILGVGVGILGKLGVGVGPYTFRLCNPGCRRRNTV